MSAPVPHRWRLVAPWYRWERRDGVEPERADGARRPALHKYTSTDFVAEFLADPQRSVTFDATDRWQEIRPVTDVPLTGDTRRRFLARFRAVPTEVRKLFLAAHQRFYLVAVGLHCDEPGFPKVAASDVSEAGFVVRRRRVAIPEGSERDAAVLLRELSAAKALARTRSGYAAARSRSRLLHPFGSGTGRVRDPATAAADALREVEVARRRLRVWAASAGLDARTEGWVPTGDGSFGAWVPVSDEPEELVERAYPMRVLGAPPGDPEHAAAEGTILWGAVPTASDETTEDGALRFDELSTYEIRAFARPGGGPCPGPLTWSEPSEPFHLAAFHDPDGCAQRPVEIRTPDLAGLEATTARPTVRLSSPADSSFHFAENREIPTTGTTAGPEQVCFVAIPLFTIVAMFLFTLFLPIVMFVFGLFWMLKLKFCLPPSATLEAGLTSELGVVDGGIQGALAVDVDVLPGIDADEVRRLIEAGLNPDPPGHQVGTELVGEFTNDPLLELLAGRGYGLDDGTPFPLLAHSLTHTAPVRYEQVRHP